MFIPPKLLKYKIGLTMFNHLITYQAIKKQVFYYIKTKLSKKYFL